MSWIEPKIALAKSSHGSVASLELGPEGRHGSVRLVDSYANPAKTCRSAAKKLRKLADKFDVLASWPDKYNRDVQATANRLIAAELKAALNAEDS